MEKNNFNDIQVARNKRGLDNFQREQELLRAQRVRQIEENFAIRMENELARKDEINPTINYRESMNTGWVVSWVVTTLSSRVSQVFSIVFQKIQKSEWGAGGLEIQ